MMRTLLISVRLGMRAGLLHQGRETVEQVSDVERARARFGVPLETERWPIGQGKALQRTVEQRGMRDAYVRGQRGRVDREAMVLRSDQHSSVIVILDRMIGAVMAKLHLQRLAAQRQAHQL